MGLFWKVNCLRCARDFSLGGGEGDSRVLTSLFGITVGGGGGASRIWGYAERFLGSLVGVGARRLRMERELLNTESCTASGQHRKRPSKRCRWEEHVHKRLNSTIYRRMLPIYRHRMQPKHRHREKRRSQTAQLHRLAEAAITGGDGRSSVFRYLEWEQLRVVE